MELAGAQGFSAQSPQTQSPRASGQPEPAATLYRSIEVVSPAEQETLWNIGTLLPVQVRFQPPLQADHRYDLAYDGQRRNLNTTALSVSLPDVFRGTHTLQVVVVDSAGAEVTRSAPRTFYVQQTSALN